MSKYDILKGLVKEILPSGEKVLMHEGDDLFHTLHGLDERMIENLVSKRDAQSRAAQIKRDLGRNLYPRDELDYAQRKPLLKELSNKLSVINDDHDMRDLLKYFDRIDSPRTVSTYHFPEEFDKYVNPDEIAQLSKQYKNSENDYTKAKQEKESIIKKLKNANPESDYLQSYPSYLPESYPSNNFGSYSSEDFDKIANDRFLNIRELLRDSSQKNPLR